jgi:hypothetical protein
LAKITKRNQGGRSHQLKPRGSITDRTFRCILCGFFAASFLFAQRSLDVLQQGRASKLDFTTLRLELEATL